MLSGMGQPIGAVCDVQRAGPESAEGKMVEGDGAATASKAVLRRFKQTEVVGEGSGEEARESLPRSLLGKVRWAESVESCPRVRNNISNHSDSMEQEGETHGDIPRDVLESLKDAN